MNKNVVVPWVFFFCMFGIHLYHTHDKHSKPAKMQEIESLCDKEGLKLKLWVWDIKPKKYSVYCE